MHFATPALLLLLALVPAIGVWEWRRAGRRPSLRYSTAALVRDLPRPPRVRLRWLPTVLQLAGIALVVVALARPRQGEAEALIPAEGIDLVLALDVSSSMSAPLDLRTEERKIDIARRVASDFIAGRENDRIGLVLFRRFALPVSPPTLDYGALQELVARAEDVPLPDGTGVGIAIGEAVNLLRDSRARSRSVVLLTDGQNNEDALLPLEAARIAEALGVRVYTIGFTIPGLSSSRPDEEELRAIAEMTGAAYFPAQDEATLRNIYEEVARLETSRVGEDRFAHFQEWAWVFLVPGIVLLGTAAALRASYFRGLP